MPSRHRRARDGGDGLVPAGRSGRRGADGDSPVFLARSRRSPRPCRPSCGFRNHRGECPGLRRSSIDTPGPVKDFALTDVAGAAHSPKSGPIGRGSCCSSWACIALSLTPLLPRSHGWRGDTGARNRLLRALLRPGHHGGIGCGPCGAHDLPFPILLDPDQRVARQAGVRVTPEAVVLASDGQVLYRGRINDLYTPDGRPQRQGSVARSRKRP